MQARSWSRLRPANSVGASPAADTAMIRPPMFPAVFSSSAMCVRSESRGVFPAVAKLVTA